MKLNLIPEPRDRITILKAVKNLRSLNDFDVLMQFVQHELARTDKKLRKEKNVEVLQGRAQILDEFIELVETSSETLEELTRND